MKMKMALAAVLALILTGCPQGGGGGEGASWPPRSLGPVEVSGTGDIAVASSINGVPVSVSANVRGDVQATQREKDEGLDWIGRVAFRYAGFTVECVRAAGEDVECSIQAAMRPGATPRLPDPTPGDPGSISESP